MTETLPASPKLRLLRVFNVLGAVLSYCVSNFGRLFLFAWFAVALYSLSFVVGSYIALLMRGEGQIFPSSSAFQLQEIGTRLLTSPWEAMAWYFVLLAMAAPNSQRGAVVIPPRKLSWLRFELNKAIWIAAAMFFALSVLSELITAARTELYLRLYSDRPLYDTATAYVWAYVLQLIGLVILAVAYAWFLPLIGQLLRTGSLHFERTQHALRGNRLRLVVLFLLLLIAFELISRGAGEASVVASNALSGILTSQLRLELFRSILFFPFHFAFVVIPAVTVGIVLDALDEPPADTAGAQPVP